MRRGTSRLCLRLIRRIILSVYLYLVFFPEVASGVWSLEQQKYTIPYHTHPHPSEQDEQLRSDENKLLQHTSLIVSIP